MTQSRRSKRSTQLSGIERTVLVQFRRTAARFGEDGTINEYHLPHLQVGVPLAVVRPIIAELVRRELIEQVVLDRPCEIILEDEDRGESTPVTVILPETWRLTAKGAEIAFGGTGEDRLETIRETEPDGGRFLALDPDSETAKDATSKVSALAEAVSSTNDPRLSDDERAAVVAEIRSLQSLLAGAKVRAAAVWNAIGPRGAIGWLAREWGSGVVQALAAAAVTALLALLAM